MSYTSTVVVGGKKYTSQREASLAPRIEPSPHSHKNKKELNLIDRNNPLEVKFYKTYKNIKHQSRLLVGKVPNPVDPMFTTYHNFKRLMKFPPTIDHVLMRADKKIGYLVSNLKWVEKHGKEQAPA